MNLTISLIGIIVALGLLAFLCFKGVNSLLAAMLSVVIIALSSRFDIVELLTGEYASGLTGFICNQLFLFVMCAVFRQVHGAVRCFARRFPGFRKTLQ